MGDTIYAKNKNKNGGTKIFYYLLKYKNEFPPPYLRFKIRFPPPFSTTRQDDGVMIKKPSWEGAIFLIESLVLLTHPYLSPIAEEGVHINLPAP